MVTLKQALMMLALAGGAQAQAPTPTLAGVFIPGPGIVSSIDSGDVDHDGHVDLVLVSHDSGTTVTLIRALGDGSYSAPETLPAPTPLAAQGNDVHLEDANGDGELDIFLGPQGVMLGHGDGSFDAATPVPWQDHFSALTGSSGVGHLNADNFSDLLLAGTPKLPGGPGRLVFLAQGDGSFEALPPDPELLALDDAASTGWLGDFDGDGLDDSLSYAFEPSLHLVFCRNLGDGDFAAGQPSTRLEASSNTPRIVDLNNDGFADFVNASAPLQSVETYLGDGTGALHFSQRIQVIFQPGVPVIPHAQGDIDGDGFLDIVVNTASFGRRILLGVGGGKLRLEDSFLDPGAFENTLHMNDLNGDGYADMVTAPVPSNDQIGVVLGSPTSIVDLGYASGAARLSLSGLTEAGAEMTLTLSGVPQDTPALLALSTSGSVSNFASGVLIPDATPQFLLMAGTPLRTRWPADFGGPYFFAPQLYLQAVVAEAGGVQLSNALVAVAQDPPNFDTRNR
ncbi:MAG: hypothetical protein DHS20C15_28110 [Planctomycetota bacterium]|nr:MAG: hypothetical protein DHS20C15_28110 [Planctomycetota bacterium]